MKVMDEKLTEKLKEYLREIEMDFDPQETKNCMDIINENQGKRISELDNELLTRIIDDEELVKEIEAITDQAEEGNAFDNVRY